MIIDPVAPFWLIVLVISLLTVSLIYQEWRKNHRFREFRMFSIVLMMLALAGILLHPKYQTEKSSSIILLTEGYTKEKVDSILKSDKSSTIMHLENITPYKNSKRLSRTDLPHYSNEIKIVLGQGISLPDLDRMENKNFQFFPSPSPTGITELHVPKGIVNWKNSVGGTFNNNDRNVSIYLESPGGKEDSVKIQSNGATDFELAFQPKQTGNYLYTLSIRDSASSHREFLPIDVTEERSLQILFLQHYPSFELQYLKNFLARKNHRMVLRYQLSKNNFRYEYVDFDPIRVDRLTNDLLEKFDLVITDSNVLSTLSLSEKTSLINSIQMGLGLLNLSPANQKANTLFPFQTTSVQRDTAVIRIASRSINFPAPRFRVDFTPAIVPVHKNKSGPLSGYAFQGAGKIGFQLMQETYRLALSGDSISYGEIWGPLLEGISKHHAENSKIRILTPFPWYQDDPMDIQIITSSEDVTLYSDSIKLPLLEDVGIDNVWYTRTWAGKPGWHRLETSDGTSLHYYVCDPHAWRSLSLMNQLKANGHIKQQVPARSSGKNEYLEEIPPLIFYLIFILSAGFVWLAPKVSRR
jgi:hypothetical protein